ncbi:MAG: hypothetical protein LUG86_09005 [Oscillospiraceae bacterium]|nr:hypothetical protein [Oscillospiraceae bacterium]
MSKIVGIDFGHCETAACYLLHTTVQSAQTPTVERLKQAYPNAAPHIGQKPSEKYEIRRLAASSDREQIVLTQMVLSSRQMRMLRDNHKPSYNQLKELGTINIGNHLPYYVEDGERFMYFKVSPQHFDELCSDSLLVEETGFTHGMAMACYFHALLENILTYSGELTPQDRPNLELLIGCPTTEAWTDEQMRNRYANLVKNATGVQSVKIVPESRAAMYSNFGSEDKSGRVSAVNGVAVFDFGSSTADFTYMQLGKTMIEFSWTLGAYNIERNMMIRALKKAMAEDTSLTPDEESIVKVEDELRDAKETYYNGEYGTKAHAMICSFEDRSSGESVDAILRVGSELMTQVVSEDKIEVATGNLKNKQFITDSWEGSCRSFFQEAKNSIDSRKAPLETIVLTGGASKMNFIEPLCQEVFPGVRILRDNNPAHSVSTGLAWVAATDEKVPACRMAAKAEVKTQLTESVKKFRTGIIDAIYEEITKKVQESAIEWANKNNDTETARTLQTGIQAKLEDKAFQKTLSDICDRKISELKNELSGVYEKAINKQIKILYSEEIAAALMLPKDILKEASSDAIFKDGVIDTASFVKNIDMSPLMRKTMGYIVKAAIVIASAAIIPGWGFLIGLILAAFSDLFIKDEDLDKKRDKNTRQKVARDLPKTMKDDKIKSKTIESLSVNVSKLTEGFEKRSEEIVDRAFDIVMMTYFEDKTEN